MIFLFIKQTLIWKEQAQHSVFYICVYIYTYVYIYIYINIDLDEITFFWM